jgi:transposase InsO family protein
VGDDSFRPFRTHKTGEWSEMGQIVGDWFQTADDCRLSDVSDITKVPEHDLIRLNQDRGFANFPKPRDGPLTASGNKRSYCGQVGRFQADTWLRLKEGAVFEEDIKERSSTVGNSEAAVVPKVITRPVVELSEVQKLTRDDYLGANEAKLKALRAASQEADEKWVVAQKSNEPVAETLPFMRAADSAKQELEKATQRAAEQKETDESARIPSYAGMYRRAEGSSKCAAPRVNAPEFRIRNDLLEKRDRVGHDWRIVLPTEKAQHAVLHSAHHALSGHASHNTMLRDISKRYWWHGMRDACTEFVDNCEHCQRFKSRTQRSFGTMAEVEEPESMGIAYSIDFLTSLAPSTAGKFDCLMVIVDRWSRRVFAIPCHSTTTAQKAAELFYEEICLHACRGIPIWLQMDRDPRFTSAWFKEFFRLTGVHLHFTTGYKSQSNGLSEAANKQLSVLLRSGSAYQKDWWKRRKMAVMKLNSTKQERLGMSPIEAERGVRPRGVMDFDPSLLHEVNGKTVINPAATAGKHQAAVKAHLDDLIGVWKDMEENRNSVQDKMMKRYDKNYRELKGMKKGQLVMVEAKHISVPAKKVKGVMDSEKLQPRYFGPYAIVAWHNGCDIEIQRGGKNGLHPRSRVHPVFHISKVKIFKGEPRRTRADELRDGKLDKFEGEGGGYKYWPLDPDEWEVSEIIDHRGEKASGKGKNKKKSTLEYFVHWAGFNVEDYTWEKESDVVAEGDGAGANELVEEYWKRREFLDSRAQASQRTGAELSEDDLDAARISYLEEQRHIERNQFRCQDANKWDERVGDCHVKSAGYERGEK